MIEAARVLVHTAVYHPNPWGDPHWVVTDAAMVALLRAVKALR